MRLMERELKRAPRFTLDDLVRKDVPAELALIATCSNSERNRIAAARVLVAMEGVNLHAEALEQKSSQGANAPGTTVNVNIHNDVSLNHAVSPNPASATTTRPPGATATPAGSLAPRPASPR
jgi:hypothetical protein